MDRVFSSVLLTDIATLFVLKCVYRKHKASVKWSSLPHGFICDLVGLQEVSVGYF